LKSPSLVNTHTVVRLSLVHQHASPAVLNVAVVHVHVTSQCIMTAGAVVTDHTCRRQTTHVVTDINWSLEFLKLAD